MMVQTLSTTHSWRRQQMGTESYIYQLQQLQFSCLQSLLILIYLTTITGLAPNLTWTATYLSYSPPDPRSCSKHMSPMCNWTHCSPDDRSVLEWVIFEEEEEWSISSRQTYPKVVRQWLEFSLHNFINQLRLEGDFWASDMSYMLYQDSSFDGYVYARFMENECGAVGK